MTNQNYHHGDLKNALIKAGVEILSREGVQGLSLRKVAKQAGVSHAAPYAHFADKQALIAAISTEGYKRLLAELESVTAQHTGKPEQQLVEGAWAYVQFAMSEPDIFKIMFSGVLEKEKDYPAFVEVSQQAFQRVVEIVSACQQAGTLPAGPAELLAVTVWSQIHGLICLALEGQISHTVLEQYDVRKLLEFGLRQFIGRQ